MFNFVKKYIDFVTLMFLIVGVVNTVFGAAVMFVSYNLLHLDYWISTCANYVLGSILSYFLNKTFTFNNKENGIGTVLRYVLCILVCYGVAYGLAKPLVRYILSSKTTHFQENVAMIIGMCLFTVMNYLGQRYFAFRR